MNKNINIKRNTCIILSFVCTVLFFGPLGLYFANAEELYFTLREVFIVIIPVSLLTALFFILVSFLLPRKAARFFGMILFGCTLGAYVQGHIINIRYGTGVMDGTEIKWSDYTGYGIINTLVWLICLGIPFVIAFFLQRKWKNIFRLLNFLAAVLILIQIPSTVIAGINYQPNENSDLIVTTEGIFDISPKENVLIFIMDTYDEAYYRAFIEENPEYKDYLYGFIHYDNTMACGARTIMAVPPMFTGVPFITEEPYSEYKNKVWGTENSLTVLKEAGYDIGFYSEALLFSTKNIDYISNFHGGGTPVGKWDIFAKKIYKLVLFKYVPHFLKFRFYMDTAEFDSAIESKKYKTYVLNDPYFYNTLWVKNNNSSFHISDDLTKVARIYHLKGTHQAYAMARDGSQDKTAALEDTAAGLFFVINQMLNDLKSKGLYDTSTIIITADHGDLGKAQSPVFLVKKSGCIEPYKDNHAPVSHYDLPIFLAGLAGKTLNNQVYGQNMDLIRENDVRERHLFNYHRDNNKVYTREFVSRKDASDTNALELVKVYEDGQGPETPYYLGTVLDFAQDSTGNKYFPEGKNNGYRTFIVTEHPKLEMPIADLPKKGELKVFIELTAHVIEGFEFNITANGHEVFQGITGKEITDSDIHLIIPVEWVESDKKLRLEFNFPSGMEDYLSEQNALKTGVISFLSMVIK